MRIKNEAQKECYDAAEIHLTKSPELLMLPCDGFFFVLSRVAYRAVHVRRRTNTNERRTHKKERKTSWNHFMSEAFCVAFPSPENFEFLFEAKPGWNLIHFNETKHTKIFTFTHNQSLRHIYFQWYKVEKNIKVTKKNIKSFNIQLVFHLHFFSCGLTKRKEEKNVFRVLLHLKTEFDHRALRIWFFHISYGEGVISLVYGF